MEWDITIRDSETQRAIDLNVTQVDNNAVLQEEPQEQHEQVNVDDVPIRGPRKVRIRNNIDENIELRHSDLANWRDNYISNMEGQIKKRQIGKQAHNAKLYGKKIVFEWGLGGELRHPGLKSLFSGSALQETFIRRLHGKREPQDIPIDQDDSIVRDPVHDQHEQQLGLGFDTQDDLRIQNDAFDVSVSLKCVGVETNNPRARKLLEMQKFHTMLGMPSILQCHGIELLPGLPKLDPKLDLLARAEFFHLKEQVVLSHYSQCPVLLVVLLLQALLGLGE